MSSTLQVQDLEGLIAYEALECLNEDSAFPAANALKQGYRDQDALCLQSDADEQLLLTVPFQQVVKLHSISVKGPSDGSAPKLVKFFINCPSPGFEDAESLKPTQEIQLSASDVAEGAVVPLNFVRFQKVSALTVFVCDNQGGEDLTRLVRLDLLGTPVDTTNMKEFKKVG